MKVKTTLLLILPALLLSSCQGHGTPLTKAEAARQFDLMEDRIEQESETITKFTLVSESKLSSGGMLMDSKTTTILDFENSYLRQTYNAVVETATDTAKTNEDIYLYKDNDKYILATSISAQAESVNQSVKYYSSINVGNSTFSDMIDYANLDLDTLKLLVDEVIDLVESSFEYVQTSQSSKFDVNYSSKGEGHFYMSFNLVQDETTAITEAKGFIEFENYFLSTYDVDMKYYQVTNGQKVELMSLDSSSKLSKTAQLTYPDLSEYTYSVS